MKKITLFLLFFVGIMGVVEASELIEMRADMVFTRCEKTSNNMYQCSTPFTFGKPIEILLSRSDESSDLSGDYKFRETKDGYNFEGTVDITKIAVGDYVRYLIMVLVASIKADGDMSTFNLAYLGSATVKNINDLNEISFMGGDVKIDNITLTPKIFIGVKDADFSVLSTVESSTKAHRFKK